MASLKPLDERVVIEPADCESATAGGIVLPDTAKESPQHGSLPNLKASRMEVAGGTVILAGMIPACESNNGASSPRDRLPATARLCLSEQYDGIVRHVAKDSCVVSYEIGDDLREQTYVASQFRGNLPRVGERVIAFVEVFAAPDDTTGPSAYDEPEVPLGDVAPLSREF